MIAREAPCQREHHRQTLRVRVVVEGPDLTPGGHRCVLEGAATREAVATLRDVVHGRRRVDELGHARVAERVALQAHVEAGEHWLRDDVATSGAGGAASVLGGAPASLRLSASASGLARPPRVRYGQTDE